MAVQGVPKENKMVKRLNHYEKIKTRNLWEEVFTEDSKKFLDYFSEKIKDNEVLVVEKDGSVVSMLHLNPFTLLYRERIVKSHYIVAVATKKEYRHQGFMSELLKEAMHLLYEGEEPFTFLMPARESIYTPFDFRFIDKQNQIKMIYGKIENEIQNKGKNEEMNFPVTFTFISEENYRELAKFSGKSWESKSFCMVRHDEKYFRRLQKEQESQNGGICMISYENRCIGYFNIAMESCVEVRELLIEEKFKNDIFPILRKICFHYKKDVICKGFWGKGGDIMQIPNMMGRIISVGKMLSLLTAKIPVRITVAVIDSIIKSNNQKFRLEINTEETYVSITDGKPEVSMGIDELTAFLFGFLPAATLLSKYGLSAAVMEKLKNINTIPVFINEIV